MVTSAELADLVKVFPGVVEGDNELSFGVQLGEKVLGLSWPWRERVHPKKPKVPNMRVLVLPVAGLQIKELLIESNPDCLFTEPHFDGYAAILVRLDTVDEEFLKELLSESYNYVINKAKPRTRSQRSKSNPPLP